ncbi:MAG: hypothetical protein IOC90_13930 [Methylocystis sp.]|nr:hypothetical protein [Methylocystis sp.]MCA3583412.1 hypothetical protein [Methylocystis sp.]MCA3589113.1 hypothetical protein [Methylocystis sp.]MCA3591931.1 hypothetical protein [Methylocystis sp.]
MISFIIELVVVVLLGFTVAYCIILDRKLQRLRADEKSMRQIVVDLGLATERAERAIEGLRGALKACDKTLGEQLRAAESASAGLSECIRSGDDVLERIGRIVSTAKKAVTDAETRFVKEPEPVAAARAQEPVPVPASAPATMAETLAAAEAFALRARRRLTKAA